MRRQAVHNCPLYPTSDGNEASRFKERPTGHPTPPLGQASRYRVPSMQSQGLAHSSPSDLGADLGSSLCRQPERSRDLVPPVRPNAALVAFAALRRAAVVFRQTAMPILDQGSNV